MKKDTNPKLLNDAALKDVALDRLNHKSIADALYIITKSCPLPFTIGTFGGWGTGKTTIANFLVSKLKKSNKDNKKKVAIVEFDVWKYENDYLRRQFILALRDNLIKDGFLNRGFKVDPRLEAAVETTSQGKIKIDKAKLAKMVVIFAGLLIFSLTYWLSLKALGVPDNPFFSHIVPLLTPPATAIMILKLYQYVSQVVTTESITTSYDKFKDPDEFENAFERIIEKADASRILIIFDNLDRTKDEKAVELLSTIKTFLEPKKNKKCVFLIQCDEDAIKKHLKSLYKHESDSSADEFLRKFFGTFIKIPPFIATDLEKYTKELLHYTQAKTLYENDDLVTVITKAFRDNPRQIKQFINTFISHYVLAIQRERGKKPIIKKGMVTHNLAPFAKLLVIRQMLTNEEYKNIIEDPTELESGTFDKKLENFMFATSSIQISNVRALAYFKKSSSELALQGFDDSLRNAFEDASKDKVSQLLSEARKRRVKEEEICKFIEELLEKNIDREQNLINIINLFGNIEITISQLLGEKALKTIKEKLLAQLSSFNILSVFKLLQASRPNYIYSKNIINKYIQLISIGKDSEAVAKISNYEEMSKNLVGLMFNNVKMFTPYKQNLIEALENGHFDNTEVLNLFQNNTKAARVFLSNNLVSKYLESILAPSNESPQLFTDTVVKDKLKTVLTLDINNNEVGTSFLQKIIPLISAYLESPGQDKQEYLFDMGNIANEAIDKYSLNEAIPSELYTQLAKTITKAINSFGDAFLLKARLITLAVKLTKLVSEESLQPLLQMIENFTQQADLTTIANLVEKEDKKVGKYFYTSIEAILNKRALTDSDFFDYVWNKEKTANRARLLLNTIDSGDFKLALRKLNEVNYKTIKRSEISRKLMEKAVDLALEEKNTIYKALNKLGLGKNKQFKEEYVSQLKSLIINEPVEKQKVAFDAYIEVGFFSNRLKQKFAIEIIEWLNTLDVITMNQEYALRIALLHWSDLSITHRDNLLNLIFVKMIAKTNNVEEINLGFELIHPLTVPAVTYRRENKTYFDLVLSRLESSVDVPIRKAISLGLEIIKNNSRLGKFNSSFWRKVSKETKKQ